MTDRVSVLFRWPDGTTLVRALDEDVDAAYREVCQGIAWDQFPTRMVNKPTSYKVFETFRTPLYFLEADSKPKAALEVQFGDIPVAGGEPFLSRPLPMPHVRLDPGFTRKLWGIWAKLRFTTVEVDPISFRLPWVVGKIQAFEGSHWYWPVSELVREKMNHGSVMLMNTGLAGLVHRQVGEASFVFALDHAKDEGIHVPMGGGRVHRLISEPSFTVARFTAPPDVGKAGFSWEAANLLLRTRSRRYEDDEGGAGTALREVGVVFPAEEEAEAFILTNADFPDVDTDGRFRLALGEAPIQLTMTTEQLVEYLGEGT